MRNAKKNELIEWFPHVDVIEVPPPEADRAAWLDARKMGLGGSDIAGILGLSPWTSPHTVWADKTGLFDGMDEEPSLRMEIGNAVESLVLSKLERYRGGEVVTCNGFMFRDRECPWLLANVDGIVLGDDGAPVEVAEGKSTSEPDTWDDGVPIYYQTQGQHYASILRLGAIVYPVLKFQFWGPEWTYEELDADEEDQAAIRDAAGYFWNRHVLENVAPPVVETLGVRDVMAQMSPEDKDAVFDADDEFTAAISEWEATKKKLAEIEADAELQQCKILEAMGGRYRAVLPDGSKVNAQRSRRFDEKAAREADAELVEKFTGLAPKLDTKALKKADKEFYADHMRDKSVFLRVYRSKKK